MYGKIQRPRVGTGSPGHGSVCQTRFWVLTCALIVALFLQSNTSMATNIPGFGFGSRQSATDLRSSVIARNIYLLMC